MHPGSCHKGFTNVTCVSDTSGMEAVCGGGVLSSTSPHYIYLHCAVTCHVDTAADKYQPLASRMLTRRAAREDGGGDKIGGMERAIDAAASQLSLCSRRERFLSSFAPLPISFLAISTAPFLQRQMKRTPVTATFQRSHPRFKCSRNYWIPITRDERGGGCVLRFLLELSVGNC